MGHVGKHGTVLLQYYTCLFLIFCYIGAARALLHAPLCSFPPPVSALTVRLVMRPAVGYVLLYNQGYKATAPLVGTVRLQLQRPEPPFRLNSSALQYCGDGTYAPDGIAYPRLQCRFLVRVHAYKAGSCRPVRLVRVLCGAITHAWLVVCPFVLHRTSTSANARECWRVTGVAFRFHRSPCVELILCHVRAGMTLCTLHWSRPRLCSPRERSRRCNSCRTGAATAPRPAARTRTSQARRTTSATSSFSQCVFPVGTTVQAVT